MIPEILGVASPSLTGILAPLAHFSHVDDKHICFFSFWLFFAVREIIFTRPRGGLHTQCDGRIRCCERTNSREMFPKKKTLSQTQSASCVNKYFLLLSDPQLSQKRDFIVFVCVGSFAEWICLTTMSAPHNTVTLHSSNSACFYFAIFRSLIYEILFLFLWRNALSFALAIEHV